MSVFAPRFYNEPSFNGLFRLIDDFDKYASQASGDSKIGRLHFTPKFDMKETETAYELHGDLPGVKKEDVHLEFTNDHTLRITGKVERSYTSGDDGWVDVKDKEKEKAKEGETPAAAEENKEKPAEAAAEEKGKQTEVTKSSDADKQVSASAPKVKYWVSERSVGEFARSFNFATHVDPDAISAKLEDGVLNVVVPKAKKPEGRRINIQ